MPVHNHGVNTSLRTRIIAVIEAQHVSEFQGRIHPEDVVWLADAVIRELDMGIPCATDGCRMRQVAQQAAKRHAESSSRLEYGDERRRSAEKLGLTGDGE